MIIGEVKEGLAELNRAARDPDVLRAVLARFGCCEPEHLSGAIEDLMSKGITRTQAGHQIRLVAFGAYTEKNLETSYQIVTLNSVVQFIRNYLREHWEVLHQAQFKDPALSFLMMLEKAQKQSSSR